MKTATREIPVYSSDGAGRIGTLACGNNALVLNEDESGTYIAYIVGRILPENVQYLAEAEQWAAQVSARDKFLGYAAAQAQNGSIYVLGAQGQTGDEITEAWIKYREHNEAANYKRAIALWKKQLGKGLTDLRAYDCSGLVVAHLMAEGFFKSDLNANGLYFTACEVIGKGELCGGDLVFKKYATKNRMYHVGVYMGDGTVVHAKGRDDGVVRENISKAGWNRFGRLKCLGDTAAEVFTRMLKNTGRPYMSGDDVRAVQQALVKAGYSPGGVDGAYGPKTEAAVKAYQAGSRLAADGIVGKATWAKLIG
jgi:Cell wall-associated hydrolases (invasion-associated proteins)